MKSLREKILAKKTENEESYNPRVEGSRDEDMDVFPPTAEESPSRQASPGDVPSAELAHGGSK